MRIDRLFSGKTFLSSCLRFWADFCWVFPHLGWDFFSTEIGKDVPYVWCCKSFCELGGCGRWKCDQWLCSWGDFTPSYGLNLPISEPFHPGFLEKISHSKQFCLARRKTPENPKVRPTTIALAPASLSKKNERILGVFPVFTGVFPWDFSLGAFWGGGWGESAGNLQFWATEKNHEGDDSLQLSSRPFTAGWEIPKKMVPWDSGVGNYTLPRAQDYTNIYVGSWSGIEFDPFFEWSMKAMGNICRPPLPPAKISALKKFLRIRMESA